MQDGVNPDPFDGNGTRTIRLSRRFLRFEKRPDIFREHVYAALRPSLRNPVQDAAPKRDAFADAKNLDIRDLDIKNLLETDSRMYWKI